MTFAARRWRRRANYLSVLQSACRAWHAIRLIHFSMGQRHPKVALHHVIRVLPAYRDAPVQEQT